MYAEQFSVRPWLEEPAKWLQWVAYGLNQQADLGTVSYNLQQFWNALNAAKAQAKTQQDWGEVETLDGLGQFHFKRYCTAMQSAALKRLNDYASASGFAVGVGAYALTGGLTLAFPSLADKLMGWANGMDATAQALAQQAQDWGSKAQAAADASAQLAAKAAADLRAAGAPAGQATNLQTVARSAQVGASTTNTWAKGQAQNILGDPNPLDFFGIPWWVWAAAAGTLAVFLLADEGPRVARSVRRVATRAASRGAKTARLAAVLL
ncbi:MAG TPA: hypothetical protein VFT46_07125 [Holophagaceae bacterium]|nr:hypothetical protein [Holophagaceae bacterium]